MPQGIKILPLGQRGDVAIWLVDGSLVRKTLSIEFTDYGHHYTFDFIPDNEVWIDKEATPDEVEFFTLHLLVERRLMKSGVPYDQALSVANAIEHKERLCAGDLPLGKPLSPEALEAVRVRQIATLPSGIAVWMVDGRKIRSGLDANFTEGGNDFVYAYVPPNEIWLDNDLTPKDLGFVLAHEWVERKMLAKGLDYKSAHRRASALELELRTSPMLLAHLPTIIEKGDEDEHQPTV
jgi:hypothetical protein